MNQVERPSRKWKMKCIGKNEAHPRIERLQKRGIVDAGGSNLILERIVCFEIVGVNVCLIRCSPDIQHGVRAARLKFCHKSLEHAATDACRHPNRQRLWRGQVILSIDMLVHWAANIQYFTAKKLLNPTTRPTMLKQIRERRSIRLIRIFPSTIDSRVPTSWTVRYFGNATR